MMGREEEGPGRRGAGRSESVQTVSSALCSTLHLRASRNVSVEGDDFYCFRSIFTRVILFISYSILSLTGTDGFRVLCRQFHTSSLSRCETCIKSSKALSLKVNKLREALLLLYSIGGQGQETRQMGYSIQHGRRCCNVCLRRTHLSATWQMTLASHMKGYGVVFVLLVAATRASLEQIGQVE